MGRTIINASAVIEATSQINSAKASVSSAKSALTQTKNGIDGKIQSRSNIGGRLSAVQQQLSGIDTQIDNIRSVVQSGANLYRSTDERVETMKQQMKASLAVPSAAVHMGKWAASFKTEAHASPIIEQKEGSVEETKKKGSLDILASLTKGIGKYGQNEHVSLASSFLGYAGALTSVMTGAHETKTDVTTGVLTLMKSSSDLETGIYKYYEKTLDPYEASKLGTKFGPTMTGLSLFSSGLGVAIEQQKTKAVFQDPNSSPFNKAAQTLNLISASTGFGGALYTAVKVSPKTLQFVNSAGKTSNATNQILATEQTLKYELSPAAKKTVSNVATVGVVVDVVAKTAAPALNRWEQVSQDGNITVGDACSVVIHGCMGGLNGVVNGLSYGVVGFDGSKAATDLEADLDTFIRGDSWAAGYIRDQSEPVVPRFVVSVGAGAYILGENIGEGIVAGGKAVGSWIDSCRIDYGAFSIGNLGAGGGGR